MKSTFTGIFCFLLSHLLFAQFPVGHNQSIRVEGNLSTGLPDNKVTPAQSEARDSIIIQAAACRQQNGSIRVTGPGEKRELQYSLDGHSFQSSNLFPNLDAGRYTIYILDEAGFTRTKEAEVPTYSGLVIDEISITPTECLHPTGSIRISTSGESNFYLFTLGDKAPQFDPVFQALDAGKYPLRITDAKGCMLDTTVVITRNPCPLYIPNVFSPNGDGINDLFQIRVAGDENVLITRFFIFDRWGNNVYKQYNLHLQSTEEWWDGTYKHFTSSAGTFDYYLEVEFENGQRETFKGNVTLIR
jgi:gliding motility-associated-like protein